MRFYPDIPTARKAAILRDLLVVVLLLLLAWLGFVAARVAARRFRMSLLAAA